MAALIPQGIQRNTSGQNSPDGACEEIINARYKDNAWRVVGRKKTIIKGVNYEQVHVHKYADFENYIGLKENTVIWFNPADGKPKQEICQCSGEVAFGQINNILLVKDADTIYNQLFIDEKYQGTPQQYPELPGFSTEVGGFQAFGRNDIEVECDKNIPAKDNELKIREGIITAYESFLGEKKALKLLEGYVFIRLSYELYDGSEVMTTPPRRVVFTPYGLSISGYGEFFVFKLALAKINIVGLTMFEYATLSLKMEEARNLLPAFTKDIIKKVNVYCTPIISHTDISDIKVGSDITLQQPELKISNYQRELNTDMLDKQMFYRIKSIDISSGEKSDWEVKLDYNLFQEITANPGLKVDDTSRIKRYGNMFVYNKRLHLYNIKNRIQPFNCAGYYSEEGTSTSLAGVPCRLRFILKDGLNVFKIMSELEPRLYYQDKADGSVTGLMKLPTVTCYPDSRVVAMEIIAQGIPPLDSTKTYLYKTIHFTASQKYNYSFYICKDSYIGFPLTEAAGIEDLESKYEYTNGSQVIVSKQYNPLVFDNSNSYISEGEIIAMAVNTEQISASQIGQFPVYLFTTEGIYALQTGDGNVLYSNMIPVSAEIANAPGVVQTKYGIVFTTGEGVKLISGSEVVNLSEQVNGEPDRTIRNCTAFNNATTDNRLYNIAHILSGEDFREYIKKAVIGYERNNDELIVSDPAKGYSYVYSFPGKVWYKITEVFDGFSRNTAYTRKPEGTDVTDLQEEQDDGGTFHIQTRPLKLGGAGFKRFVRMAARGEFMPQTGHYFSMYVFGSQDLKEWKFLTGKQVNRETIHLVLQGIPHTYRYAVIVLGGNVRAGHLLSHLETNTIPALNNKIR